MINYKHIENISEKLKLFTFETISGFSAVTVANKSIISIISEAIALSIDVPLGGIQEFSFDKVYNAKKISIWIEGKFSFNNIELRLGSTLYRFAEFNFVDITDKDFYESPSITGGVLDNVRFNNVLQIIRVHQSAFDCIESKIYNSFIGLFVDHSLVTGAPTASKSSFINYTMSSTSPQSIYSVNANVKMLIEEV